MASVNKAILIGNLGKDPELRYTPSGQAVAKFSLATTRKWRDKDGQSQEQTTWHNIVCWGRQAEIANEYLRKGRPVYIDGRIDNRSYEDKDGVKKYISEVVVRNFQFLGGRDDQSGPSQPPSGTPPEPPADVSTDDDDLPF
ncbi:MAG: single-stranded DNA-binding protein [candidate division Zixibacteria bacterium]|nr:single-stranded DNA-binding protein [candidate division Zixibacteria bacterium]